MMKQNTKFFPFVIYVCELPDSLQAIQGAFELSISW